MMNTKKAHITFTFIFLTLLIVPNVIMFTSFEDDLRDNEKRTVKKLDLSKGLIQSFATFNSYYKNNFGLKKSLTTSYIDFKNQTLMEDPIPHKVVTGKNNWYFLGDDFSTAFSGSLGINKYTKEEVQLIVSELTSIATWLKDQNIKFYLAIPPNKHTVYKEYLPMSFGPKTKYDPVFHAITSETDIPVIDLKTPLLAAKKTNRIYYKTDSHWNDYGAYVAYQTTVDFIQKDFPEITAVPLKDYRAKTLKSKHQEMTRMINLDIDEEITSFEPTFESLTQVKVNTEKRSHFFNPAKKGKAYFCRDSFSNAWTKYFKETFAETILVKTYRIHKKDVLEQQPDFVVLEFVERKFDYFIKHRTPILY